MSCRKKQTKPQKYNTQQHVWSLMLQYRWRMNQHFDSRLNSRLWCRWTEWLCLVPGNLIWAEDHLLLIHNRKPETQLDTNKKTSRNSKTQHPELQQLKSMKNEKCQLWAQRWRGEGCGRPTWWTTLLLLRFCGSSCPSKPKLQFDQEGTQREY